MSICVLNRRIHRRTLKVKLHVEEELHDHESMTRWIYNYHKIGRQREYRFPHLLRHMNRWIVSQVGRKWDVVWSDFKHKFDKYKDMWVSKETEVEFLMFRRDVYVDDNGILRKVGG